MTREHWRKLNDDEKWKAYETMRTHVVDVHRAAARVLDRESDEYPEAGGYGIKIGDQPHDVERHVDGGKG